MRADEFFADNRDLADACRSHPFLVSLADGSLDRESFCYYIAQDAAFLDAFARAYALGAAKAPDAASTQAFTALLKGSIEEVDLHRGYAARWGVELGGPAAPATTAYTDFLLGVAADEPAGHLCAAMAPCMRLYAWLGQELRPTTAPGSPYREWVETYADPAFEALAATLEDLLDRLGGDPVALAAHYRTAMRLELAFFDAAANRQW